MALVLGLVVLNLMLGCVILAYRRQADYRGHIYVITGRENGPASSGNVHRIQ